MNSVRLSLTVALAFGMRALAQNSVQVEPAFSADRPGFATSTSVLQPGIMPVEGGVALSVDRDGDVRHRTMAFGTPMIRVCVSRFVELPAGGNSMELVRNTDCNGHDTTAGWPDLVVGVNVAFGNGGNRAFTSSTCDPTLAIAWQKNLPAGLSAGGTLTGTSLSDEGVRRTWYASALSAAIPLPDRLAGLVEIYAASSDEPGNGSTWVSNAGVSRNFGPDLQIDMDSPEFTRRRLHSDVESNGPNPSGTQLMLSPPLCGVPGASSPR